MSNPTNVGLGQNYAARIQSVLNQATNATKKFTSQTFPTVTFGEPGEGILGKVAPYIIYGLVGVFVILLILTIVHYTITPIFNFGDNPNALITVQQGSDWDGKWKEDQSYYDVSGALLPAGGYSIVFDMRIKNQIPSTTMGNKFVLLYKTTEGGGMISGKPTPITNFQFLNDSQMSVNSYPNLLVAFDSLSSKVYVYLKVSSQVISVNPTTNQRETTTQYDILPLSGNIITNTPYRIGIVVSNTICELYINGKYVSTALIGNKTIVGSDADTLFAPPIAYKDAVEVRNLFTVNRAVNSGSIRTMGGPALMTGNTGV